jgi:uncharacterized membrane-anchored protein YjiN (DUF445 family)
VSDQILQAVLTIFFGALAGGLTNSVAIWMLFHPYEPPTLFGRTIRIFQGAIPKNQARLAAAVGRTVGTRLLTEEDLTKTFADSEFRGAFDDRLSHFLETLLERDRGSVRELLPASVMQELESILEEVVQLGLARLQEYLASDTFVEFAEERARSVLEAVADEPVAGILTPAREAALEEAVEDWLEGAVESDGFKETVEDYVSRATHTLLEPGRTFEEVLPLGLVGSMEKAISSYLPLALQRLGRLLEDPQARARFERTLHELFHRFLRDLNFYQRVVARLIVTEETVDRVLDTIEAEGAERLSAMLREQTIQDAMARGVNDAIVDFLRRPVDSVLGQPEDDSVLEAQETLTGWAVGVARDPATRAFLVEKLGSALDKAGARTWGEILDRVPAETLSRWLVTAARSDAAADLLSNAAEKAVDGLLDRPIGTPAKWLPPEAPRRLEGAIGDPLWGWLQTQVPDVVHRINVAGRVEEKVLNYPTPKMEELVKRVTDRELRLIVRLGYVLGAVIGSVLVIMDAIWQ